MGASINGIAFDVDPQEIRWDYDVKTAVFNTIGGKVIQLYGWSMGDLVIGGHFGGKDPIASQRRFFSLMRRLAERQTSKVGRQAGSPARFRWPEQGWDFWVYIKSMQQKGAGVAIERNVQHFAPQYQLTFFIYQDNGDIVEVASQSAKARYLQRLSAGLGWEQSQYNGPEDFTEVLQGQTILDWTFSQYGLIPSATDPNVASQVSSSSGGTPIRGGVQT